MTMINSRVSAQRAPRFLDRFFDFGGAFKNRTTEQISAWRSRKLVKAMLSMDDFMLDDMGIDREDIANALKTPLSENPSRILARSRRCRIDAKNWGRKF